MSETVTCVCCGEEVPLKECYESIYEPVCLECDTAMRQEYSTPCYGFFLGGDPRNFTPDTESCTPEELALHKEHCEAWDRGEKPKVPTSVTTTNEKGESVHIRYCNYGIGVNEKGVYG